MCEQLEIRTEPSPCVNAPVPLAFDPDSDRLPASCNAFTLEEVRSVLVDAFQDSTSRSPLFEQFCTLLRRLNTR
jgi:hypothetical protein